MASRELMCVCVCFMVHHPPLPHHIAAIFTCVSPLRPLEKDIMRLEKKQREAILLGMGVVCGHTLHVSNCPNVQ